jgi:hypothetical protein
MCRLLPDRRSITAPHQTQLDLRYTFVAQRHAGAIDHRPAGW